MTHYTIKDNNTGKERVLKTLSGSKAVAIYRKLNTAYPARFVLISNTTRTEQPKRLTIHR